MNTSAIRNTERAEQESPSYVWGLSGLRFHYYGMVLLSLLLASTVTGRMGENLDRECAIMQMAQDETVHCLNQLQDLVRYLHVDKRHLRSS